MVTTPGPLGGFVPEMLVVDLPFLFRNTQHFDHVAASITKYPKEMPIPGKNFVVFACPVGSLRQYLGAPCGEYSDLPPEPPVEVAAKSRYHKKRALFFSPTLSKNGLDAKNVSYYVDFSTQLNENPFLITPEAKVWKRSPLTDSTCIAG